MTSDEHAKAMTERRQPNAHRLSDCGKYVYIALKDGKETLVDAYVYADRVRHYRWYLRQSSTCEDLFYVGSSRKADGSQKTILLHRLVLGIEDGHRNVAVDHINRNGLDNRLENLRLCSNAENQLNTRARRGSVSRYKGVTWSKRIEKWGADIQTNGRKIFLGRYSDEHAAAVVHNIAAAFYHGEFANLNRIPGGRALIRDILNQRGSCDDARAELARLLDERRIGESYLKHLKDQQAAWGESIDKMRVALRLAEDVCHAADEYTSNLGQHHYWKCEAGPSGGRCTCGGLDTWQALARWREGGKA